MIYKYALKLTKLPNNANKYKIKVLPYKYLFHEINYVLGKHCLRSPKKRYTLH